MDNHKKILLFIIVLILGLITSYGQSEPVKEQEQQALEFYFNSSALFNCKIRVPVNYNSKKKYNLIIGLHGGGSSHEKFIEIWQGIKDVDFIYAAPQAPYSWLVNKQLGYDWSLWPSKNREIIKKAAEKIPQYISDLITQLRAEFPINHVYLLGFSQGCIFTYIAGLKNYRLFKGIICLSGPGIFEPLANPFTGAENKNWISRQDLDPAKKLKVFIGHGRKDKRAKYKLGLKSRDVLKQFGYEVTFRDFDGGHTINRDTLNHILAWLKIQK